MAKIVVLGAGIAGHTAATHLRRKLGKEHEVLVVSPNSNYQWVPSNIWVGIGKMTAKNVIFPLIPLYKKKGIHFKQAKVVSFHPEGGVENSKPNVQIEYVAGEKKGSVEFEDYDYLINATGPKLAFDLTPGLIPGENKTFSVCTYGHATEAWEALRELIQEVKKTGAKKHILIGTGHAKSTCQGAAFEYILNVEKVLRDEKVRDKVDVTWISNEYELGDFGMDGLLLKYGRKAMHSKEMVELIFEDRNIKWIKRAGVTQIEDGKAHYDTLEEGTHSVDFDFGMLIPAFSGHGFKAYDKKGEDITSLLFKGFMLVDADYSPKPYEDWRVQDWPETYQNPSFNTIYAPGIAFAPPHSISKPRKNAEGVEIFPAPPRTGMPSGITAKLVADNIIDQVKSGKQTPQHKGSLGNMGAACIASAGYGMLSGSGVSITTYPIVPDYQKYPTTHGRKLNKTFGKIGLAGHWLKLALHHAFIYKAKMKPFWWIIPE